MGSRYCASSRPELALEAALTISSFGIAGVVRNLGALTARLCRDQAQQVSSTHRAPHRDITSTRISPVPLESGSRALATTVPARIPSGAFIA